MKNKILNSNQIKIKKEKPGEDLKVTTRRWKYSQGFLKRGQKNFGTMNTQDLLIDDRSIAEERIKNQEKRKKAKPNSISSNNLILPTDKPKSAPVINIEEAKDLQKSLQGAVWDLKYKEKLTYKKIAEKLQIAEKDIKVLIEQERADRKK